MNQNDMVRVRGACHCGAVAFVAEVPRQITAHRCNCSICAMTGFVHVIVPDDRFTLLTGADSLETYRFNTNVARHLFCRVCGVKAYYVPRSHPGAFSMNLACLQLPEIVTVSVEPFDGQNWEREVARLRARREPGVTT